MDDKYEDVLDMIKNKDYNGLDAFIDEVTYANKTEFITPDINVDDKKEKINEEGKNNSSTHLRKDYIDYPVFNYSNGKNSIDYSQEHKGIITDFQKEFIVNGSDYHIDHLMANDYTDRQFPTDWVSPDKKVTLSMVDTNYMFKMSTGIYYGYSSDSYKEMISEFKNNTPDEIVEFNGLILGVSNYSDVVSTLGEPDNKFEENLPFNDGNGSAHSICLTYRAPDNTYAEIWCTILDDLKESVISSITLYRIKSN